jgi:hypothetical protein
MSGTFLRMCFRNRRRRRNCQSHIPSPRRNRHPEPFARSFRSRRSAQWRSLRCFGIALCKPCLSKQTGCTRRWSWPRIRHCRHRRWRATKTCPHSGPHCIQCPRGTCGSPRYHHMSRRGHSPPDQWKCIARADLSRRQGYWCRSQAVPASCTNGRTRSRLHCNRRRLHSARLRTPHLYCRRRLHGTCRNCRSHTFRLPHIGRHSCR